ncbi:hypothetical protein HDU76_000245 [Blyttiomyces sp. JEL0837]|nr:hypothetical protein HDU76_000245 [Blyttiomyces sp. JEL0837]
MTDGVVTTEEIGTTEATQETGAVSLEVSKTATEDGENPVDSQVNSDEVKDKDYVDELVETYRSVNKSNPRTYFNPKFYSITEVEDTRGLFKKPENKINPKKTLRFIEEAEQNAEIHLQRRTVVPRPRPHSAPASCSRRFKVHQKIPDDFSDSDTEVKENPPPPFSDNDNMHFSRDSLRDDKKRLKQRPKSAPAPRNNTSKIPVPTRKIPSEQLPSSLPSATRPKSAPARFSDVTKQIVSILEKENMNKLGLSRKLPMELDKHNIVQRDELFVEHGISQDLYLIPEKPRPQRPRKVKRVTESDQYYKGKFSCKESDQPAGKESDKPHRHRTLQELKDIVAQDRLGEANYYILPPEVRLSHLKKRKENVPDSSTTKRAGTTSGITSARSSTAPPVTPLDQRRRKVRWGATPTCQSTPPPLPLWGHLRTATQIKESEITFEEVSLVAMRDCVIARKRVREARQGFLRVDMYPEDKNILRRRAVVASVWVENGHGSAV